MVITDVRVFPVDEEKLKAFVSIIIDDCFVVSDIKIISGTSGLFISMPSKKRKNGTFRDIAHPLNSETRRMIEDRILACYREAVGRSGSPAGDQSPSEGSAGADGHEGLDGDSEDSA
jgi:stage V sporulation protein G